MSGNRVYAELVLTIGSVSFYECKSNTFLFGKSTYYWKFNASADHFGPFDSLLEAGMNFDVMMRGPTPPKDTPSTVPVQEDLKNVILVDFKNKKRIK